ncbi:hypothetical protein ACFL30_01235 [Candidatus Latescibacterota bacterium]
MQKSDLITIVPANKYVSTFVNIIRFTPLKFPPIRGDAEGRGVLFLPNRDVTYLIAAVIIA